MQPMAKLPDTLIQNVPQGKVPGVIETSEAMA
jgi:hypothetical protein